MDVEASRDWSPGCDSGIEDNVDSCDICSWPFNSTEKRIACIHCRKILCISCEELSVKLKFMTNYVKPRPADITNTVTCNCHILLRLGKHSSLNTNDKRKESINTKKLHSNNYQNSSNVAGQLDKSTSENDCYNASSDAANVGGQVEKNTSENGSYNALSNASNVGGKIDETKPENRSYKALSDVLNVGGKFDKTSSENDNNNPSSDPLRHIGHSITNENMKQCGEQNVHRNESIKHEAQRVSKIENTENTVKKKTSVTEGDAIHFKDIRSSLSPTTTSAKRMEEPILSDKSNITTCDTDHKTNTHTNDSVSVSMDSLFHKHANNDHKHLARKNEGQILDLKPNENGHFNNRNETSNTLSPKEMMNSSVGCLLTPSSSKPQLEKDLKWRDNLVYPPQRSLNGQNNTFPNTESQPKFRSDTNSNRSLSQPSFSGGWGYGPISSPEWSPLHTDPHGWGSIGWNQRWPHVFDHTPSHQSWEPDFPQSFNRKSDVYPHQSFQQNRSLSNVDTKSDEEKGNIDIPDLHKMSFVPNEESTTATNDEKTSIIRTEPEKEILKENDSRPKERKIQQKKKLSKHICAGCGRRDCEGQFMKMMKEMNVAAKKNNFTIHNVVPDGNCMFAAIVDQLETSGGSKFSSKALRQACVEHLRSNPESEDGTHYGMFMDGETWTEYLDRMSQEGQWGDHLILQAISQVTQRNVEILQGAGRQEITKISSPLAKENEATLHLGHVGEFHYVSLRELDSADQSHISSDEEEEEMFSLSMASLSSLQDPQKKMFSETYVDIYSDIPAIHFSFLLRKTLPINTTLSEADRAMHTVMSLELPNYEYDDPTDTHKDGSIFTSKGIGDAISGLYVSHMISTHSSQSDHGNSRVETLTVLNIINKCHAIRTADHSSYSLDVCIDTSQTHHGYAHLKPNCPDVYQLDTQNKCEYIPNNHGFFLDYSPSPSEVKDEFSRNNVQVIKWHSRMRSAILCKPWPIEAEGWIKRPRKSDWPPNSIISLILDAGCHLVGDAHEQSTTPDLDFRFSFDVAERVLCTEALNREQRYCLIVFLGLCYQQLGEESLLTSRHLKSIFYYACEELPPDTWNSSMGSCLFYLLDSLMSHIDRRNIPCYFIPENNMIDHLTNEQHKLLCDHIGNLRQNPLQHTLNLCKEKEDSLFTQQVVIADMDKFKITKNVRESVLNCFVPHSIQLANGYIIKRRFKVALETLQAAYEERLTVSTCDDQVPFQSFFNEAVQNIPVETQWWFLLFSDERLCTTMAADMSFTMDPVPLHELIPSISRDYADRLIPRHLSVNICRLYTDCAWFFLSKYRTQQALPLLIFCIGQYEDKLRIEQVSLTENKKKAKEYTEILSCYQDFNDRNMFRVLVYLYYTYKRLQENMMHNYVTLAENVCQKLGIKEAFYHLYWLEYYLGDKQRSDYWWTIYLNCQNSDPSLEEELYLDTIKTPEI